MSIIRIGSNKQYADGWESIFGGPKRAGSSTPRGKAAKARPARAGKAAPAKVAKRTAKKKKRST